MNFWEDIVDLQFVLSVVAIFYYSCILLLMLTSKSAVFRSAFFRIYIVTGFFDILAVVAIEWIRADLKNGFGPNYEIASRIASAMTGTNFFTHLFGCFLMTANRYTAACHPNIYEKFWSPNVLYILLFIDISVAYLSHFPLFLIKFVYEWRNNSWILTGRENTIPTTRLMIASVATIYEVLSLFLIARTIYAIRAAMKGQKARRLWQEMGLVMVTAVDCLLGALECIYEISALFGLNNEENPVIYWVTRHYKFYMFLFVTMNAYSIMFLSSSLRHEALKLCRCGRLFTPLTTYPRKISMTITSSGCRIWTRRRQIEPFP
ncbi:hypothetical protein Aduo_010254 [Ancylostoma duodenale]